jgi:hypothetical protein
MGQGKAGVSLPSNHVSPQTTPARPATPAHALYPLLQVKVLYLRFGNDQHIDPTAMIALMRIFDNLDTKESDTYEADVVRYITRASHGAATSGPMDTAFGLFMFGDVTRDEAAEGRPGLLDCEMAHKAVGLAKADVAEIKAARAGVESAPRGERLILGGLAGQHTRNRVEPLVVTSGGSVGRWCVLGRDYRRCWAPAASSAGPRLSRGGDRAHPV